MGKQLTQELEEQVIRLYRGEYFLNIGNNEAKEAKKEEAQRLAFKILGFLEKEGYDTQELYKQLEEL